MQYILKNPKGDFTEPDKIKLWGDKQGKKRSALSPP